MSSLVPPRRKEGKHEPYLSYACNLFLRLPHARRYINAPSAPTTALAQLGGTRASGPAEVGEGKGNCKAVAQQKMQQSKGQMVKTRLIQETDKKWPVQDRS